MPPDPDPDRNEKTSQVVQTVSDRTRLETLPECYRDNDHSSLEKKGHQMLPPSHAVYHCI